MVLVFGIVTQSSAQSADSTSPDTTNGKWTPSLIAKAAVSQVGFQNWAEGGVNTLGLNLGLDGKMERETSDWSQVHELRLSYGVVKQDTLDFRKSEDIIRLATTFKYTGDGMFSNFSPTIAASFRSQFAPGYNYKKNPFEDGRKPPVKVSDFMNPATLQQAVGFTYTPTDWFNQRLGIGAKETIVVLERLRALYGVKPSDQIRFELGIESYSEFDKEVAEHVHFKSTLGLFAAFNKPDSPDLLWENFVAMKVNSWLSVNVEWAVLYDSDVSSQAQFKEVFAVGISYILL